MSLKYSKIAQGCLFAFSAGSLPSLAFADSPWKVTDGTHVTVTSGYDSTAAGDYPLYAEGNGSVLESIDGLTFSTHGDYLYGASVKNGGAIVLNNAQISTQGSSAHAVNVYNGQFTMDKGSIIVEGYYSSGINASQNSDITLSGLDIAAKGDNTNAIKITEGMLNASDINIMASGKSSQGIVLAYGSVGQVEAILENVSVVLSGKGTEAAIMLGNGTLVGNNVTISTSDKNKGIDLYNGGTDRGHLTLTDSFITSENGHAVYVMNGDATLVNTAIGTDNGFGVNVNKGGTVTLNGGSVTTQGDNAFGTWLATGTSLLEVDGTSFITYGNNAIAVDAQYGQASLKNTDIKTTGTNAYGLYSENLAHAENLNVETVGEGAIAVFAAGGGKITLNNATLSTQGESATGILTYSGSTIEATDISLTTKGTNSPALWVNDGTLSVSNSEILTTGENGAGLLVSGDRSGVGSTIVLDNVSLTSQNAGAILTRGAAVDISLLNGTQLIAGNGILLDDVATQGYPKDVTLTAQTNVTLQGDIRAATENNVHAALLESSNLTGAINGTDQLSIDNSSQWFLTSSSSVGAFSHEGTVEFQHSDDSFHTLMMTSLSGNGNFLINTDLAAQQGDLIVVDGQASGDHWLGIKNSGKDPDKSSDVLTVVDTQGGDASFSLQGDVVDVGTYQYELQHRGDDWVLAQKDKAEPDVPDDTPVPDVPDDTPVPDVPDDTPVPDVPDDNIPDNIVPVLTPTASTAIGMFNTLPTVWNGELATLRTRMGEVREGNQQGDAWVRLLGNQYDVTATQNIGYEQTQSGISVGVDAIRETQYGQFIGGIFTGYSYSDVDFDNSSTGSVDSFFIGGYATWLLNSGWFVDAVAKANNFSSSADARMSDGTYTTGSYSTPGFGLSLEVGRQFTFENGWFVEPSVLASALWIKGESYEYDNGLEAKSSQITSKQLALNGVVGKSVTLENGVKLQPWIRVGMYQELADNNDVSINGNDFTNDMSGTRGEYGVGISAQITPALQVYTDARYSKGSNIESPWGANLGVRWRW
ncbi:autotransporter outer membrane beta-barrel domain-containing protein [Buttiauxella sp.]|uniref:autotransporter outer membrane beta-barrel domain-containing protein n=1 Tax=Buttiauxella sp. TaxID=1972222 RepID=UPI003C742DDC